MDFSTEPVFDASDFDTKESLRQRRRHAVWVLNTLKNKSDLNKYGAYLRRIGRIPPRKRRPKVIDVYGSKLALAARLARLDDVWFDVFRGKNPVYVSTRDWEHACEFSTIEELPHGTPWHVVPQIQEILRRGGRVAGLVGCRRRGNRFEFRVPDGSVRVYIGMRYNFWRNTTAWAGLSEIAPKTEDICYHPQSNVQAHHRTRTSAALRDDGVEQVGTAPVHASEPPAETALTPTPTPTPTLVPTPTPTPTPTLVAASISAPTSAAASAPSCPTFVSGSAPGAASPKPSPKPTAVRSVGATGACYCEPAREADNSNDGEQRSHDVHMHNVSAATAQEHRDSCPSPDSFGPGAHLPAEDTSVPGRSGDGGQLGDEATSGQECKTVNDERGAADRADPPGERVGSIGCTSIQAKRPPARSASVSGGARCVPRSSKTRNRKRKHCGGTPASLELSICLP